jgi:hypothetical protein
MSIPPHMTTLSADAAGEGKNHWAETAAFGLAMCKWSPALLITIRAGASPMGRGIETAADWPAANTVSNRATAAWSATPCWVVTTTRKPSGAAV